MSIVHTQNSGSISELDQQLYGNGTLLATQMQKMVHLIKPSMSLIPNSNQWRASTNVHTEFNHCWSNASLIISLLQYMKKILYIFYIIWLEVTSVSAGEVSSL